MQHHGTSRSHRLGGYEDLRVWQLAVELATECYLRTAAFPLAERFGLTAQMRRAAVSVVSNIAEGHGRGTRAAFAQYLAIARGSVKELEAQATLAARLGFVTENDVRRLFSLSTDTARMLHGLRKSLLRSGARNRSRPTDVVTP